MLTIDDVAPDFSLPRLEQGEFGFYKDVSGEALLVFYKFSCPTCRLTFPFVQKMFEAYDGKGVSIVSIAQDRSEKTVEFRKEFGITMPVVLDLPPYPASTAYQIVSVPTIFLVNPERKIIYAGEGFLKWEISGLNRRLAQTTGQSLINIFEGKDVPEFKPG